MKIDRALVRWLSGVGLVAWLPVMACAGATDAEPDVDGKESGSLIAPDAGTADPAPPTFADVYAVIELHCGGGKSGCHVAGKSGGLEMPDADAAYAHLVEVTSMKCPAEMRVVPGDPDASQLVQVLEGKSACVKPMPLGRDPLSADDLGLIRAWIEAGAESGH